jgi:pSer/pThr/pTyr-binding forkhead associated (FHA) protein
VSTVATAAFTLLFVVCLYGFLWFVAVAIRSHLTGTGAPASFPALRIVAPSSIAGRTYRVVQPLVAGRSPDADIRLDDPFASDLHVRFAVGDGGLLATDLGSTNGTFLNEAAITGEVTVRPGDTIRLGETIMEAE